MSDQLRLVLVYARDANVGHWLRLISDDNDIQVVWHSTIDKALRGMRDARADVVALQVTGATGELELVEAIMSRTPMPIILLAETLPDPISQRLVMAGALEVLRLPTLNDAPAEETLRKSIRTLARVKVVLRRNRRPRPAGKGKLSIVGIAASTGGPEALGVVLADLVGINAPVLVVQHIHPAFLEGFVKWMNTVTPLPVLVAHEGDTAEPGKVYIAPNHVHLGISPQDRIALFASTSPAIHVPSANALFTSMAEVAGARSIGVVLTGMGDDGAQGLQKIGACGGYTIVQDEASCVVFGMGRAALLLARAHEVVPLTRVGASVRAAVMRSPG